MPRHRAPSVCAQPGCPHDQPCPDHPPKAAWAGSTRSQRLPKNWNAIKARIKRRDAHTCQACFGTRCGNKNLEIDHVKHGDDHSDENLQTLGARPCHLEKTQAEAAAARAAATTDND